MTWRNQHSPSRIAAQVAAVSGARSYAWKGDEASYSALHSYLVRHFPKRGTCDWCARPGATQYALIHGREYSRNRDDYHELCSRCHGRYDHGGESSPSVKLTAEQVEEIRRRYVPSKGGGAPTGRKHGSTRSLAQEYGVSHTVIRQIVGGRKWAKLEEMCG